MVIGIIGAFEAEIKKLVELFHLEKDIDSLRDIYVGNIQNKKLVVCNSGIGKVNSASMTQYIIDKYGVNMIINSGCAGSLTNSVKIMDIIVSSSVTYHDFLPTRIMKFSVPDDGNVKADSLLIKKAEEILKRENIGPYFVGSMASGDCFVTDKTLRDSIYKNTKALCVDMESAPIGHIAKINSVPFVAIRTISDFSDGIENFEEEAAYQSSMLVKKLIEYM